MTTITYTPPATIKRFIRDHLPGELFYDWIVGPVGSGKTTGIFFKLCRMAKLQEPGRDGVRRTRAVIVRNTMPQLKDTTLSSWAYWFKHGQAGTWRETEKKFMLCFDDVECEVLFRALDTPDDVARVLSLEVTFGILDEFVEIPREIVDALSARCGRYPSKIDGGATNWGMWGSSNPSTEDNWWYDYLHAKDGVLKDTGDVNANLAAKKLKGINTTYFLQPSGFSDDAENVENLPGERAYYTNQAKNKSEAWVKQFLEAEWGYSVSGQPVVPTFNPLIHVTRKPLMFNPLQDLVLGMDPGVSHTAVIMGQEDLHGRLLCMGELTAQGYGADRFIREMLKPYLRANFAGLDMSRVLIAPDPAAANRAQTDEKSVIEIYKKHFKVSAESNNRLPLRLNAIEHFSTRLTGAGPALLLDQEKCPQLIRALKGGWRYVIDPKKSETKATPDKNPHSHPGDAFGYLARYFHRQAERGMRYGSSVPRFVPPRSFGASYHMK